MWTRSALLDERGRLKAKAFVYDPQGELLSKLEAMGIPVREGRSFDAVGTEELVHELVGVAAA